MKKQIAILGSTGSIGTQALQVIAEQSERFEVYALTANQNVELLIEQAKQFLPDAVVINDTSKYRQLKEALANLPIKVYAGEEAICDIVKCEPIDIVLVSLVGFSGLKPTLSAILCNKTIALANKETLVVAGELINRSLGSSRATLIPVDSEHSAILQCLEGESIEQVEKLILTASGGPFRSCSMEELQTVTKDEALKHPNWNMGAKVTIDSATMMNKGFEVIEAHWLFGIPTQNIEVVIHPQSIIHSMVQFTDGAIKAQLGVPDMRLPIQYALTYPFRMPSREIKRLDFSTMRSLTFEHPDTQRFRNLDLAYYAMRRGGNVPCVLNAANEIMVDAFLHNRISFTNMSYVIELTMERVSFIEAPTYDEYVVTDAEARRIAAELIKKFI
jgi:1-deoxy-D-xylulose-5-phosphate reductoisomerase